MNRVSLYQLAISIGIFIAFCIIVAFKAKNSTKSKEIQIKEVIKEVKVVSKPIVGQSVFDFDTNGAFQLSDQDVSKLFKALDASFDKKVSENEMTWAIQRRMSKHMNR